VLATVVLDLGDCPLRTIKALLGDLDPNVTLAVGGSGCDVGDDRANVGSIDDVVSTGFEAVSSALRNGRSK
jgi:hypothetical protein